MAELPQLKTQGRWFIDDQGRVVWLRGANVGGGSKVPSSAPGSMNEHETVSYIDRPFSLEDADDNLSRLQNWGFNFLRITVTWEALEHAGHGKYDEDYLTYLRTLLSKLPQYGLRCFVCMHQDVWSRLCGGSGAPGWTLTAAGFDLSPETNPDLMNFDTTGSAYMGGIRRRSREVETDRGRWPTGYQKLICSTMNTLFWAGKTFAPQLMIQRETESVNIQDYLQDANLAAFKKLVDATQDLPSVIGYEYMNEPHPGYCTLESLHAFNYNTDLHLSVFPSALQSMALGAGHTQSVPFYKKSWPFPSRKNGMVTVNLEKKSVWTNGCVWEKEGVWGWDKDAEKAVVLRENYFRWDAKNDREYHFYRDFYYPAVRRWSDSIKSWLGPNATNKFLFIENVPNEYCPDWPEESQPNNMIYAPHWYDLNAMFQKSFGYMTVDVQGLSRHANVLGAGYEKLGQHPAIMGECGVPMDLNRESAFGNGDFTYQARMMDALISGLESNLTGFTLWCYNTTNSDIAGDDEWNGENFSWFSQARANMERETKGLVDDGGTAFWDAGGRLLDVIVRPYPSALCGTPISSTFNAKTLSYTLQFNTPTASCKSTKTLIYLPSRSYLPVRKDVMLSCSSGELEWFPDDQLLVHHGDEKAMGDQWIKIRVLGKKGWFEDMEVSDNVLNALLMVVLAIGVFTLLNKVHEHFPDAY